MICSLDLCFISIIKLYKIFVFDYYTESLLRAAAFVNIRRRNICGWTFCTFAARDARRKIARYRKRYLTKHYDTKLFN